MDIYLLSKIKYDYSTILFYVFKYFMLTLLGLKLSFAMIISVMMIVVTEFGDFKIFTNFIRIFTINFAVFTIPEEGSVARLMKNYFYYLRGFFDFD